MSEKERETETLRALPPHPGPRDGGRSFLFVVEEDASCLVPLPESGEVIIGRAQDAHVRLNDPAASRRHACLSVLPHEVRIRDLESHNGTFVNGEMVTLPRMLLSGDSISICNATLILHRQQGLQRSTSFAESAQLRQRLEDEIDRALRYHRPLALLVLDFGPQPPDRAAVQSALAMGMRRIDLPAWESPTRLALVAPELSTDALPLHAARLLESVRPLGPVRLGHAACPADGCDADTLIACGRAAAVAASPGQVLAASSLKTVRQVGEDEVILADPAMQRVYQLVERLAQSDIPVLITGETGTGKELIARALHAWSRRERSPLISINCATLTESIAESQLFGHVKGAFTGAHADHRGFLESANGGTVFFDELGEIALNVQAKLLRALESRRIQPVGASTERPINVRVVAATNRDLPREIRIGRFREDLYYRIHSGVIALPPLRSRKRELPILARSFLEGACRRQSREPLVLSDPVMERLLSYPWPGNVRQLKNEMEFLAATVEESVVEPWHLSTRLDGSSVPPPAEGTDRAAMPPQPGASLQEEVRVLERRRIKEAMERTGGAVKDAAALLGMPWRTLYYKLKQYELQPSTPE